MQATRRVQRRKGGEKTAFLFTESTSAFDSAVRGCIVKGVLPFVVAKPQGVWIAGFLKGRAAEVRVNEVLSEKSASPAVSLKSRRWALSRSLSQWIR
ncbi:hypothetical protein ERJ75_000643200 [Trypanosoma vivax]|nr:hypothetical protein ERJ75_000643200 [Trypanosoma vivax]